MSKPEEYEEGEGDISDLGDETNAQNSETDFPGGDEKKQSDDVAKITEQLTGLVKQGFEELRKIPIVGDREDKDSTLANLLEQFRLRIDTDAREMDEKTIALNIISMFQQGDFQQDIGPEDVYNYAHHLQALIYMRLMQEPYNLKKTKFGVSNDLLAGLKLKTSAGENLKIDHSLMGYMSQDMNLVVNENPRVVIDGVSSFDTSPEARAKTQQRIFEEAPRISAWLSGLKNQPSPLITARISQQLDWSDSNTDEAEYVELRPITLGECASQAVGARRLLRVFFVTPRYDDEKVAKAMTEPPTVNYLIKFTPDFKIHEASQLHFDYLVRDLAVLHTGLRLRLTSLSINAPISEWQSNYDARLKQKLTQLPPYIVPYAHMDKLKAGWYVPNKDKTWCEWSYQGDDYLNHIESNAITRVTTTILDYIHLIWLKKYVHSKSLQLKQRVFLPIWSEKTALEGKIQAHPWTQEEIFAEFDRNSKTNRKPFFDLQQRSFFSQGTNPAPFQRDACELFSYYPKEASIPHIAMIPKFFKADQHLQIYGPYLTDGLCQSIGANLFTIGLAFGFQLYKTSEDAAQEKNVTGTAIETDIWQDNKLIKTQGVVINFLQSLEYYNNHDVVLDSSHIKCLERVVNFIIERSAVADNLADVTTALTSSSSLKEMKDTGARAKISVATSTSVAATKKSKQPGQIVTSAATKTFAMVKPTSLFGANGWF